MYLLLIVVYTQNPERYGSGPFVFEGIHTFCFTAVHDGMLRNAQSYPIPKQYQSLFCPRAAGSTCSLLRNQPSPRRETAVLTSRPSSCLMNRYCSMSFSR